MSDRTSSVLGKASHSMIARAPFPHIVIREALPADLYVRLEATFPTKEILECGRPLAAAGRYAYSAATVAQDKRIDPAWRSFFAYHASDAFFQEVVSLFGATIREDHPHLEERLGRKLTQLRTNVRSQTPREDAALDVQFVYNSASLLPARIIGPHLDRPVALYAGLLYLRHPQDHSTGGDLEFWRFKGGHRMFQGGRKSVRKEDAERVQTIAYESNTLVFFPHSANALHAVSERSPSVHPRLHVNLIAEFPDPIYHLEEGPA